MNTARIYPYNTLSDIVVRLRDDLNSQNFVLLYAFNGTGKTRLSMAFGENGKQDNVLDTLYFNAYTEDLFSWDNDLENDTARVLRINSDSNFFNGFKELALEDKIFAYLERYANFDFRIDYENWTITFSKGEENHIKVSRGEENMFIWCIFLAICELTLDGAETYNWVKYIYIDDPVSSLDENNTIAVASDLSKLLKKGIGKVKIVVSSHHSLFFNVMCNELKKAKLARYFLHKKNTTGYTLQKTDDTPFFHHVALLSELKRASESGTIDTYHFNMLRSILEKTAVFFGFDDFSKCIHGVEDEVLFARALNLLSHGAYSIYNPVEMGEDTKNLFNRILAAFLDKYQFELPVLLHETPSSI
jgi:AAA domain